MIKVTDGVSCDDKSDKMVVAVMRKVSDGGGCDDKSVRLWWPTLLSNSKHLTTNIIK